MEDYRSLKRLIESSVDDWDIGEPASKQLIEKAEEYLGIRFPSCFRSYLETWGTLAVGPLEYFGIVDGDFESGSVPDGVWFTTVKRRQAGLPDNLFVVFDNNGAEYHCVDLSNDQVVAWDSSIKEVISTKSDNICRYLVDECSDWVV